MPKPPQPRRRVAYKHPKPTNPGLRRDLAAAEAAIARVRALADELDNTNAHGGMADGYYEAARRIREALDEPKEPRPNPEQVAVPLDRLIDLETAEGAVHDLIAWCEDPQNGGKDGLPHPVIAQALRLRLAEPKKQPAPHTRARCRCGHTRDLHNEHDCAGCTRDGLVVLSNHTFIAPEEPRP